MNWLRALAVALGCAGAFCLAQARPGPDSNYNISIGGGGAYVGPGDIVSGAWAWHGLMAYSAAKAGTKAVNACHSTGGVDDGCADLSTDATTGKLVAAVVDGTHTCPGAGCNAKILYDQTGSTNCNFASIACDLTQNTVASRPSLTASCLGSLPCLQCAASQSMAQTNFLGGGGPTGTAPYTYVVIANRTGAFTSLTTAIGTSTGPAIWFFNLANTIDWFAAGGGDVTATATDNVATAHALIGTNSSASSGTSVVYVDGSSTSASVNGIGANGTLEICDRNGSGQALFTGNIMEDGVWPVAFNGTQAANMNSNMHSRWGL